MEEPFEEIMPENIPDFFLKSKTPNLYSLKEYYTEEIKNTPSNEKRLDKLN